MSYTTRLTAATRLQMRADTSLKCSGLNPYLHGHARLGSPHTRRPRAIFAEAACTSTHTVQSHELTCSLARDLTCTHYCVYQTFALLQQVHVSSRTPLDRHLKAMHKKAGLHVVICPDHRQLQLQIIWKPSLSPEEFEGSAKQDAVRMSAAGQARSALG